MTLNEIEKKFSFEDKSKIFIDDVHEYFTTYYNNNDGSEDTKEECLIRDGRRIVMHAKKIINDQKEEIDRLNSIIRNLSLSINKQVLDAQDEILNEFIKQLTNENILYKIKEELTYEKIENSVVTQNIPDPPKAPPLRIVEEKFFTKNN